jgi:protein-tyrosine phosphatase
MEKIEVPYSEIIPNLFIGNLYSPHLLLPDNLGLIVNCTKDLPIIPLTNTIQIPVDDSPDECINFINYIQNTNVLSKINDCILKNEKVLVHCKAGAQRSCALVAAYLLKYHSIKSVDKVIQFIRNKRNIAFFGHVNFMNAIMYFNK